MNGGAAAAALEAQYASARLPCVIGAGPTTLAATLLAAGWLPPSSPNAELAIAVAAHCAAGSLAVVSSATMSERLATPLARPRFGAAIIGALAAFTMLPSVVGIHGVMAATVRERQRELGIRLAPGPVPAHCARWSCGRALCSPRSELCWA